MDKRKQKSRVVSVGIAYVEATFNNTRITISDPNGSVLAWFPLGVISKDLRNQLPTRRRLSQSLFLLRQRNTVLKQYPLNLRGPELVVSLR